MLTDTSTPIRFTTAELSARPMLGPGLRIINCLIFTEPVFSTNHKTPPKVGYLHLFQQSLQSEQKNIDSLNWKCLTFTKIKIQIYIEIQNINSIPKALSVYQFICKKSLHVSEQQKSIVNLRTFGGKWPMENRIEKIFQSPLAFFHIRYTFVSQS